MADIVRRAVLEADGGSRGNPGPAAYGALVKDADTGRVLAEEGTAIGVASNNVAEYRGLIAALRLAAEVAPEADVEVRMDSKLVVEQMSGRWKIKHPDMRPLAMEANRLVTARPGATSYTWVPRALNQHADRLANEALDGLRSGVTIHDPDLVDEPDSLLEDLESPAGEVDSSTGGSFRGWSPPGGPVTTLVLVRHGATVHTAAKRFSGGLASSNPGLSEEGRAQVREVADWLAPLGAAIEAVVASPVRRTVESAQILAARLDLPLVEEPGFAEMEFGSWDGLTFAEVQERQPDDLAAWLGSLDISPGGGGETFHEVEARVLAGLARVLERYAGKTVAVVSHVTPIKTLVAHAVDAPLTSLFRMELSTASVSVVSFLRNDDEGLRGSLRLYNAQPPGAGQMLDPQRW
ncbi:bifunctional RNase H/acid phosphatase [Nocardioides cynanchi]|uniref:bifunctional RNase H/acid phosphatase n=1 Tax=Nocardioides cynanchi TaxID=2558918 RepID=UPI001EE35F88|nr:bifunctional RNase H/acid phosphatase [Nocardioides cynanchi]